MPSITAGGIRIFSGASAEEVEDKINKFLVGDGKVGNLKKQIMQPPALLVYNNVFYALVTYQTQNNS